MSRISALGEFGLIDLLTRDLKYDSSVKLGIGDDCAIVRGSEEPWLFSTDAFIEDIHFRKRWASPEDIGFKAAAAALSDIGAMGGIARHLLVTLACPEKTDPAYLERVYEGIRQVTEMERVNIIGGDTTASPSGLSITVTVIGVAGTTPVRRSGARPGDIIAVTGHPGSAFLGLHALENEDLDSPATLRAAQLRPYPKLMEGQFLGSSSEVTAMIDVSDGLVQDLGHMARASNATIAIQTDLLPLSLEQISYAAHSRLSAVDAALSGGEDYELALAIAPDHAEHLITEFTMQFVLPLTRIGTVIEGAPEITVDGRPFSRGGFDHFYDLK